MKSLSTFCHWAGRHAAWSLLLLVVACSGSDTGKWVGDYVTVNDFEAMRGWTADANAVTRTHSHSGQFAIFVGPDREYSSTYDLPLYEANPRTLRGVSVEAWVYLPSTKAAASLDVQIIDKDNHRLFGEELLLLDQVKEGAKWTRVQRDFIFPAGIPGDAHLRIFLWRNTSTEPVFLDDLRVKALE